MILRNITRFVVVVLFQVLVMDQVMINAYMIPYVYLLFILLMPFETPSWAVAFWLCPGAQHRPFQHTLGMHTAATVLAAFLPGSISWTCFPPGMDMNLILSRESITMVFLVPEIYPAHRLHPSFRPLLPGGIPVAGFLSTLLRVILSTILSTSTIVLSQYFVFRK
jgi:hypothetical protein